ncbi:Ubiquitin carboxyl-terminal hydrolase 7 [Zea mays]|uniref:Ubiquitin carboxyl-terminal hydrolase n=1 Tax=Zea mays TaxID=4577 RepID=A0A3L6FRJ8_MAIZE|nr:Ubiquitin carboxyl-terminal hydrolase 7 [Zea mays]
MATVISPLSFRAIRESELKLASFGMSGCRYHVESDSLLLGWGSTRLYSVSAWRPNKSGIRELSVKWQKELFPGIEIDTSQPPIVFKTQLYTLTGVPPERQKIMVKGGILKDDADWSTLGVKDGQKLMMIGTADEIVKAPEKGPVFVEDLPEEEQVIALYASCAHLSLQLWAIGGIPIPEFSKLSFFGDIHEMGTYVLYVPMALGVGLMGHSAGLYNLGNTCYMNSTLQCLHSVPELKSALLSYSDTVRGNGIDQASHNLTVATRNTFGDLDQSVRPVAPLQFLQTLRKKYPQFAQQHNNVYMQQDAEECWTQLVYTLSQTLTSDSSESAALPMKQLFGIDLAGEVHRIAYNYRRKIWYRSSSNQQKIMVHCAESGEESMETESVYSLKCHISQDVNHLHEGIKHKVDYPLELDVYEFCSDELKQKLQAPRQMLRDAENAKFGLKAQGKASGFKENEKQLTGVYDLVAVLTHKGRSADSGHYVGWVKQDDGKWIEFDDDNPNIRKEEDILKLSGGGDWHMAYICLYKARMAELKS